ncbi:chitinase-3-like protein 1 [Babylonia areolata]|uniref:chitinase-3-like protein 1 n=1 Tax=Babylonia areolata TaxID=304850 RepID=UPI003FD3C0D5
MALNCCVTQFLLLLILLLLGVGCHGYVRVCYYTNWAQFRAPPARFVAEDVDPFLCTHIVFAFAGIHGSRIEPTEFNDEDMYRRLLALKTTNPALRVLLSVGGWRAGGASFSQLVSSRESMLRFVGSATRFLRRHGLDGLDLDWEFPGDGEQGGSPGDRVSFTRLLQLLREGFDREAARTGRERLLLTAALVGDIVLARQYYQIPQIARLLDHIHLMAYDFYGPWDPSHGARHHSALYPDVHRAVESWLQEGAPRGKIVLGVPAFARTFILAAAPRGTGVGQSVVASATAAGDDRVGIPSNITGNNDGGLLTYQEVCQLLGRRGGAGAWRREWLQEQQAPVVMGTLGGATGWWGWAGYDDVVSVSAKAGYVRERGLAGAMLWSVADDDFNDRCGQGRWPLLTSLRALLPTADQPHGGEPELAPSSPLSTTPRTMMTTTTATLTMTNATNTSTGTATNNTNSHWWPLPRPRLPPPPAAPSREAEPATRDTPGRRGHWGALTSSSSSSSSTTTTTTISTPAPTALLSSTEGGAAGYYRQCSISDTFGPSLSCPEDRGRSGSRTDFYLYCFSGFFAIQCRCLPGFFYNRCLRACDAAGNSHTCPGV